MNLDLTCKQCGKNFSRPRYRERQRIRDGNDGPYCSTSCASKSRTNPTGGNHKMTAELVSKMRACDRACIKVPVLMETFQMSRSGIYEILSYRKWKDVPDLDGVRRSSRPVVQGD